MKKILIFTPAFYPAFKGGGPIKSLKNLVELLSKSYDVCVYTQNIDVDGTYLSGITPNKWLKKNGYSIFYTDTNLYFKNLVKISKNKNDFDLIYFSGFLNLKFTLIPLLFLFNNVKILLSPRGEFCDQALEHKSIKKNLFMFFLKIFFKKKLFNIVWHFTSGKELNESKKNLLSFGFEVKKYYTVENLVNAINYDNFCLNNDLSNSKIKIVFLSRISPMKNLKYALEVLLYVKECVQFDIYGPNEDEKYWDECKKIISNMPQNISIKYLGPVSQDLVSSTLSKYDIFFLPTKGENFGHVIFEAFSSGLILLISNNTPWRNLEKLGVGHDISLDDFHYFVDCIERYAKMDSNQIKILRYKSIQFIENYLSEDSSRLRTLNMFESIINNVGS